MDFKNYIVVYVHELVSLESLMKDMHYTVKSSQCYKMLTVKCRTEVWTVFLGSVGILILHLQHQHSIWMPVQDLVTPLQIHLPAYGLEKQTMLAQVLGLLHSSGRHGRSSRFQIGLV